MLSPLWESEDYFRLLICHSPDGRRLAMELERQLPEYGFVCRTMESASNAEEVDDLDALLNTVNGLVALLTPGFFTDSLCNQAAGVAIGRGVHVHSIEISAKPSGLLKRVPSLAVPTDASLPRVIAQFVSRDPLSSQRLSLGAVRAFSKRMPSTLIERLPCLESLRVPSSNAVVELQRIRQTVRGEIEPSTVTRIDRLIERWQSQILDDAL